MIVFKVMLPSAIGAIPVTAVSFEVAKLCKLAEVALSGGDSEVKVSDDFFRRDFVFIGYKSHYIDQFLGQ